MADDSAQDRHLPASQRKLKKAREDGQIPRSRDLGHFAAIAAGGGALVAMAPTLSSVLQEALTQGLRFDHHAATHPAAMGERLLALSGVFVWVAAPMGALMMLVGVAAALASGGWVWTLKPLGPNFGKLSLIAGLPRLLSKQQLTDTLKGCTLALLLGAIGGYYLSHNLDRFSEAFGLPLPAALSHTGQVIQSGLLLLLLVLGTFALIDVPLQRHMHASRLKMSHQEAKQEYKELEGNAEVKAKVRARMREMANRRMLAAVPGADLVVMNPTHYAVALRYDEATMAAPQVIAKGADLMAMRIRDKAREHKVPVLQAPVLARALYAHAEIDREIPGPLFAAVAQVLAYVYQLRAALTGKRPMPAGLPELQVPPELDPHHGKPPAAEADA